MRAPGHPQGCFALEQSIDELAEKLEIDPLTFREKIDEIRPAKWSGRSFSRRPTGEIERRLVLTRGH